MGLSEEFRYALLIEIVFLVAGVGTQLAAFTILLKWVLAGAWRFKESKHGRSLPSRLIYSLLHVRWEIATPINLAKRGLMEADVVRADTSKF